MHSRDKNEDSVIETSEKMKSVLWKWQSVELLLHYSHNTTCLLILRRIKFTDKKKLNIATPTALPLWGLVLLSCPQLTPWVQVSTFVSGQHFLPVETETRSTIVKLFRDSFNSWREVLLLLSSNFPSVNITGSLTKKTKIHKIWNFFL